MKHEFDKFAKEYRTTHSTPLALTGESSAFFAEYKAQKLAQWLPEFFRQTPKKILDFGCGDGLMTHFTQKEFPNSSLYGVDPSSESIKILLLMFLARLSLFLQTIPLILSMPPVYFTIFHFLCTSILPKN